MVAASDVRLAVGEVQAKVADADLSSFRDPVALRRLLRWLAEHETEPVNSSSLAEIIDADPSTVRRYVQRLQDAGVIFEVPAWRPGVMTRERKRTSYCYADGVRLVSKIDTQPASLGWFARRLQDFGDVGNYVQGQDIDTDLVYLPPTKGAGQNRSSFGEAAPEQATAKQVTTEQAGPEQSAPSHTISDISLTQLNPAMAHIAATQHPVAIVVADLSDQAQQQIALTTARNRASVISSFFYRTDVWVAVVGVAPADFDKSTTSHKEVPRRLELLVHQPCRQKVPTRLDSTQTS